MPDVVERVERQAHHVAPDWDEARSEMGLRGLHGKLRRRAQVRTGAVLLVVGFAGAFVITKHAFRAPAVSAPPVAATNLPAVRAPAPAVGQIPVPTLPRLVLHDGSIVSSLEPASEVEIKREAPRLVVLELRSGRAAFDVAKNARRAFRVQAGGVTTTVLGTAFIVERSGDRVGVSVQRGEVRVDWASGSRKLLAGESGVFPPLVAVLSSRPSPAAAAASAQPPPAPVEPPPPPVPPPPAGPARDGPDELLRAADAARREGRAEEAMSLLQRIVDQHGNDTRAPLAAFTLGRLLFESRRFSQSAEAFATCRRLEPRGLLAEDALAREVDSWARGRDPTRAAAGAREYLRLYPLGRRADEVRQLGGVE